MAKHPSPSDRSANRFSRWGIAPIFFVVAAILFVMILLVIVAFLFLNKSLHDVQNAQPAYSGQELYQQAAKQVNQGQYAVAESYLEQALSKEDDSTYRSQLAVVKYRLKKYDESIRLYQQLADKKQDLGFVWNGIGNAYRDWAASDQSHQTEYAAKAEDAYNQALKADPLYVAAYSNLGLMLQGEHKNAQAAEVLQRGIALTKRPELGTVLAAVARQ